MDRVSEIGFFSTRNQCKKWVERKLNKAFLHFFAKYFDIFDDFSKFCSTVRVLHFKKIIKYWQNMRKNLVQLAFNQFFHFTSKTRNPDFGYYFFGIRWYYLFLQNMSQNNFQHYYYSMLIHNKP